MKCIRIFIITIIIFIVLLNDTASILIPIFLLMSVIHWIKFNKILHNIWLNSFIFYAFVGVINYSSYIYYCGMSRAPFGDDSYYYDYAINILNGEYLFVRFEPYSYFLSLLMYPFKWMFDYTLLHYELLPINWFIGATTVALIIYFTELVLPINNVKHKYLASGLILFNSCYIDGVVHLYRDGLVCLMLILAFIFVYNQRYVKGIFFSLFVGILRGANGIIALLYTIMDYIQTQYKFSRRTFISMLCLGTLLFCLSFSSLGVEKYTRSFSNASEQSMSLEERLSTFHEQENAQGGVIKLLRSSNPIYKAIAIPIYMLSPFKMGSLYINHFYSLRTHGWQVTRLRVESIWEGLNVIFYVSLYISLLFGIYYWFKDLNLRRIVLLFIFLITVILVTLISMQARHKMAFIIFFPLLYSYYYNYSTPAMRRKVTKYNICFALLVIIYNIL